VRLARALVLALIPFLAGVAVCRAQETPDDHYAPATRSNRPAVLARSEVADLAAEVFGPELAAYVAAIAWCESTGRPGVESNWPYVGLMQIDPDLHAGRVAAVVGYPVTLAEARVLLRDPLVNLRTAHAVWRDQGWSAWPACSRWA